MEDIQHHCYPPQEWSNNKDHTKSRHAIVREATTDPRVMSRKLKVSLAVATVNGNESTIRRTLKINGVHGRVARKKATSLQKEHCCRLWFTQDHVDKPEGDWKNVLWLVETKIEPSV